MSPFDPQPAPGLRGITAYRVPGHEAPADLALDGNEGMIPPPQLVARLAATDPQLLRRYPSARRLERRLAERHGVAPERVLVTAGADEALDRVCRALLAPGREIVMPQPTFAMLPHYVALAGGEVRAVAWEDGPYPVEEVTASVGPRTAVVALVSPNNPTGATASREALARVAAAAPHALVLVDHAYVEFADEDLTAAALELENALVLRTFSKALGLAGLRVGYALGPPRVLESLRAAGGPYSVSSLSLATVEAALDLDLDLDRGPARAFVDVVRRERSALGRLLAELGADPIPSQANFVCARFADARWVHDGLAGMGIAVRRFPGVEGLEDKLRITCPGDDSAFGRLERALRTVLAPQALLFDLDGVLADVSGSYRRAVVETAATFGVELAPIDVARAKARGGENNDWELTRALLQERDVEADLHEVTGRFQELYLGGPGRPGLHETERLIPPLPLLQRLAERLPLGIVTGRPRADLERFLERSSLAPLVRCTVCMEDGPSKPDPAPVALALERLGVERAWMIGDTPHDVRAARGARALPLGLLPPGTEGDVADETRRALVAAGAGRVLAGLEDLEELLP